MKRLISWTKRTLVLTLSLFAITTSGFATNDGDPEMVALLRSAVDHPENRQASNSPISLIRYYLRHKEA